MSRKTRTVMLVIAAIAALALSTTALATIKNANVALDVPRHVDGTQVPFLLTNIGKGNIVCSLTAVRSDWLSFNVFSSAVTLGPGQSSTGSVGGLLLLGGTKTDYTFVAGCGSNGQVSQEVSIKG